MNNKKNKNSKLGFIEGWTSVVVNVILFVLKLHVGMLCNSVSIIADAWHTLSDTITSFIVIIGFWISARPADKKHPFGHGRFEYIAAIIIGVFLGNIGVKFFISSMGRLFHHKEVIFSISAVIIFIISIIVKGGLSYFAFWAAKKAKSESIKADAWHHMSDVIASFLIVMGIFVGKYFWWVDGVLGIAISLLILKTALDIIMNASNTIMGESPDSKLIENINKIVNKHDQRIIAPHHYHLHKYGSHTELTFHIKLPRDLILYESNRIVDDLKIKIFKLMSIDSTIYIDPV
jgi:cation diffusion facilitator family transporter